MSTQMTALLECNAPTEIDTLRQFVELCAEGFHAAEASPDLMEALRAFNVASGKTHLDSDDQYNRRLDEARRLSHFANTQRMDGFSYLFGIATVKLWSIVEAAVDDLVIGCLLAPTDCADVDMLKNLKGPLLEFAAATPQEQAEFLLSELKLASKTALRLGVGTFEALLEPVGMRGRVEDRVRKNLLEAQQVRHVIVHRRGVADKQLLERCPWLNLTVGAPVSVDGRRFHRYIVSAQHYAFELVRRTYLRAEQPEPDTLAAGMQKLIDTLQRIDAEMAGP